MVADGLAEEAGLWEDCPDSGLHPGAERRVDWRELRQVLLDRGGLLLRRDLEPRVVRRRVAAEPEERRDRGRNQRAGTHRDQTLTTPTYDAARSHVGGGVGVVGEAAVQL